MEQKWSVNKVANVNIYDPTDAKIILFKILCGMHSLHSSDVVHLNISPVAILITPTARNLLEVQLGCLSKAISTESIGANGNQREIDELLSP